MKKILALVMVLWMVCGMALAAEGESTRMGNDVAGYITADEWFTNFVSVDIPAEKAEQMKETMGYCQYVCMEGPAEGMIVTMMGYTAADLGEGGLQEHVNLLANTAYSGVAGLYEEPACQSTGIAIDEVRGSGLLVVAEQNKPDDPMFLIIAIPYHVDGYYGVYYFENFEPTDEVSLYIQNLLTTYEPGTK